MGGRIILVPVDGSESSLAAVSLAADIARCCQAELKFLCIVNIGEAMAADSDDDTSVLEAVVASGKKILAEAMTLVPPEVNATGRFISGEPREEILGEAAAVGAWHIVMGSRGFGRLRAALMGSVSAYVLEHADCPVTVVKGKSK